MMPLDLALKTRRTVLYIDWMVVIPHLDGLLVAIQSLFHQRMKILLYLCLLMHERRDGLSKIEGNVFSIWDMSYLVKKVAIELFPATTLSLSTNIVPRTAMHGAWFQGWMPPLSTIHSLISSQMKILSDWDYYWKKWYTFVFVVLSSHWRYLFGSFTSNWVRADIQGIRLGVSFTLNVWTCQSSNTAAWL